MVVSPTIPIVAAATLTEAPRVFMDTMEDMAMDTMERGKQSLAMVLHLSMCPRLTMVTVTILPTTLMVTTLDMVMAMESVKLSLVMAMVMLSATLTGVPRVFMDTMEATDMATMARGRLSLVMAMAMLQATIIEAHKVFMDIMVTMGRDLLMLDTMVVQAPMFTRAALTIMDLMAMASTIMARDLPTLVTMAMDIM